MEKPKEINIIYMTHFEETIKYRFIIFRLIGPPKRIQSDRGTVFQDAIKIFFKRCGIQHITPRAYHPQAQGKIERSHGTWKNKLRYDILNCVEGDICFLFFILRPIRLTTMRSLYSNHL